MSASASLPVMLAMFTRLFCGRWFRRWQQQQRQQEKKRRNPAVGFMNASSRCRWCCGICFSNG